MKASKIDAFKRLSRMPREKVEASGGHWRNLDEITINSIDAQALQPLVGVIKKHARQGV